MDVIELAMRRSRTVVLSLLVILVSGVVAYLTIPKEAEPDIEIPIVYVSIEHDGISPEDSERLLVRPMEQELRSIEGVKEMTANAYEGGANVQLEFDAGVDTKRALQDVREKVDLAQAKLPGDTEEPTVNEVKMSRFDPMLVLNLAGDVPERTLTNIAKDLEEKLEADPDDSDQAKARNWITEQERKGRKNARVADTIMVALPIELKTEQRLQLLTGHVLRSARKVRKTLLDLSLQGSAKLVQ